MIFHPLLIDDNITEILIEIGQQADIFLIDFRIQDFYAGNTCFKFQLSDKQLQHIGNNAFLIGFLQSL